MRTSISARHRAHWGGSLHTALSASTGLRLFLWTTFRAACPNHSLDLCECARRILPHLALSPEPVVRGFCYADSVARSQNCDCLVSLAEPTLAARQHDPVPRIGSPPLKRTQFPNLGWGAPGD